MTGPTIPNDRETDTPIFKPPPVKNGPVTNILAGLFLAVVGTAVVYMLVAFGAGMAQYDIHPDVKTPVHLTTYLGAIGFNADSPTVSVGHPALVSAGEISGSWSEILGFGGGSIHGKIQPGLYYPVKITIDSKNYTLVLKGDSQLVTDSSVKSPVLKFKTDPALTDVATTSFRCGSWNPFKGCTATKHPAMVPSELTQLRNGVAAQLIQDNIGTLTVPPGVVPPS